MAERKYSRAGSVVFVGNRGGAIRAARALNLQIHLIDKKEPTAFVRKSLASFEAVENLRNEAEVRRAAERAIGRGAAPGAVLALTESAVVSAAQLREKWKCPGLSVAQAHTFSNKSAMKEAVIRAGVKCTPWKVITAADTCESLVAEFGLPLVLKEVANSGSRGTVIAHDEASLRAAWAAGSRVGGLAEAFIDGLEMSVESIVHGGNIVFTNFTEYYINQWANIVPGTVAPEIERAAQALNVKVIQTLGLRDGITHLEFYWTKDGIVFGEIAARPPGGYLMELIHVAYGFNPWTAWLQAELSETPEVQTKPQAYAGVLLFHPGEGVVESIAGLEWAIKQPKEKFSLRLNPGDRVDARLGTGQNKGEVIVSGSTRAEVAGWLDNFAREIRIIVNP
ncbi:MAG: ATP-grasp domain-containing protein [Bacteriovoracia bacterium]